MKKGQNLAEFGLIGSLIVGVCVLSLLLFSDNLSGFFNKSSVTSVFNSNRTLKAESLAKYITNINIKIGDNNFNSPVESVIAEKINQNNYQQTSGSSGQIRETLDVIIKYIDQIKLLLASPTLGLTSSQISELQSSLDQYQEEINAYVALDNNKATSNSLKLAQALDISVNFSLNGNTAEKFYDCINNILTTMDNSPQKNLLSECSNSILNLGASLDYKIDSRQREQLGLKNKEAIQNNSINGITDKAIEISGSLANYVQLSQTNNQYSTKNFINNVFQYTTKLIVHICGFIFGYSCNTVEPTAPLTFSALSSTQLQNLAPKFDQIDKGVKEINQSLKEYLSNKKSAALEKSIHLQIKALIANKDYIQKIAPNDTMLTQLNDFIKQTKDIINISTNEKIELISKLKNETLTEDQVKSIEVYRNGTYQDIVPNTYNNIELCKNIGGTVENNECKTN